MASARVFSCRVLLVAAAVPEPATEADGDPWLGVPMNESLYDSERVSSVPSHSEKWLLSCSQTFQTRVGQRGYVSVGSSATRNQETQFADLKMTMGKRFGVLLCAPDQPYVKKKYGGYFGLYKNSLSEVGETWELFRFVDGQFSDMEDLYKYGGFVIIRSRYDAF